MGTCRTAMMWATEPLQVFRCDRRVYPLVSFGRGRLPLYALQVSSERPDNMTRRHPSESGWHVMECNVERPLPGGLIGVSAGFRHTVH